MCLGYASIYDYTECTVYGLMYFTDNDQNGVVKWHIQRVTTFFSEKTARPLEQQDEQLRKQLQFWKCAGIEYQELVVNSST